MSSQYRVKQMSDTSELVDFLFRFEGIKSNLYATFFGSLPCEAHEPIRDSL